MLSRIWTSLLLVVVVVAVVVEVGAVFVFTLFVEFVEWNVEIDGVVVVDSFDEEGEHLRLRTSVEVPPIPVLNVGICCWHIEITVEKRRR